MDMQQQDRGCRIVFIFKKFYLRFLKNFLQCETSDKDYTPPWTGLARKTGANHFANKSYCHSGECSCHSGERCYRYSICSSELVDIKMGAKFLLNIDLFKVASLVTK